MDVPSLYNSFKHLDCRVIELRLSTGESCCRYEEQNAHGGDADMPSQPMLLLTDIKLLFTVGDKLS